MEMLPQIPIDEIIAFEALWSNTDITCIFFVDPCEVLFYTITPVKYQRQRVTRLNMYRQCLKYRVTLFPAVSGVVLNEIVTGYLIFGGSHHGRESQEGKVVAIGKKAQDILVDVFDSGDPHPV